MYEDHDLYQQEQAEQLQQGVARYMSRVMGWMCVGLLTTLTVALVCLAVPGIYWTLYTTPMLFGVIVVAQLGMAIGLSAGLRKISATAATVLFMLYAALTGVTFSTLFLLFELFSMVYVFGVTAFVFVALSLYGMLTRRDLTRIGTLAMFGLMGIILAGIVNIFLGNGMLDLAVCAIGVVIFIALTAYDTQRIKGHYLDAVAMGCDEDGPELKKVAIYGALNLYLDFINLFLKLLRLVGRRR